jgi:hypothetical protein
MVGSNAHIATANMYTKTILISTEPSGDFRIEPAQQLLVSGIFDEKKPKV